MSSLLGLCYRGVSEVAELGSPMRDQSEPKHGLSLATFSGYDARLGLAETFPCLSTDQGTTQPQEAIRVAFLRTLGLQQQQQKQKHLVTCTFEPSAARDADGDLSGMALHEQHSLCHSNSSSKHSQRCVENVIIKELTVVRVPELMHAA